MFHCGNGAPDFADPHLDIPIAIEKSSIQMPFMVPVAPQIIDRINSINSLSELFGPEEILLLRGTELVEITSAVKVDSKYVVVDYPRKRVLRFDKNGSWIGDIGSIGQGPGEFQGPTAVKVVFDQNVAVVDILTGMILVYSPNGDFITSFHQEAGSHRFIPQGNFVWAQRNRLYLCAFASGNQNAPWHVILDVNDKDFSLVLGFGSRFEPYQALNAGSSFFGGFAKVDSTIWTGSPYGTKLEIFDLEGRFVATLASKGKLDGLKEDDFDGITLNNINKRSKELRTKTAVTGIFPTGDLVVVSYFGTFDIYDIGGNLLRENLKRGKIPIILCTSDETILSPLPLIAEGKNLDVEERIYLVERLGVDLNRSEDYNPFLRVGKIFRSSP